MDSAPPDPGVVVQVAEMGVVPPLPDPLLDEEPPELDVLPDPLLDEELPELDVVPDPLLDEDPPELDVLPDPLLDEEPPELDVPPDPLLDEELPELDVLPDPPLDEEVPDVVEPEVPDAEGDPSLLLPPHPARQSAALNSDTRTLDCCTFLIVFSLSKKPGHDGPGWIGGIDRARWRHLRQATRCQSFKGP